MTKQVRDWNKDMKRVESFKYVQTLVNGIQPRFHGEPFEPPEPVEYVLEYWLQQYAAEKERSDTAEQDRDRNYMWYRRANEKLQAAEAREKKLRELLNDA